MSKSESVYVSKTFPISKIVPLIDYGHTHFGENKFEALIKWTKTKGKERFKTPFAWKITNK